MGRFFYSLGLISILLINWSCRTIAFEVFSDQEGKRYIEMTTAQRKAVARLPAEIENDDDYLILKDELFIENLTQEYAQVNVKRFEMVGNGIVRTRSEGCVEQKLSPHSEKADVMDFVSCENFYRVNPNTQEATLFLDFEFDGISVSKQLVLNRETKRQLALGY
ncbi:MAG: hypothetical protein HYZ85_04640 [Candidatus Omnitrophica bacterium]|nr:hypothetical protein [Candidatus Omnitrophota bacterium]